MKSIRTGLNFKSLVHQNKCSLYIHEYQAHDLLKKYKLPLVPVPSLFTLGLQSQHP